MTGISAKAITSRKKAVPLVYVLVFASVLFIGILAAVYIITKHSNPIMLDEHGKPVATAPFKNPAEKGIVVRA